MAVLKASKDTMQQESTEPLMDGVYLTARKMIMDKTEK